jgi:hypothetical protein
MTKMSPIVIGARTENAVENPSRVVPCSVDKKEKIERYGLEATLPSNRN